MRSHFLWVRARPQGSAAKCNFSVVACGSLGWVGGSQISGGPDLELHKNSKAIVHHKARVLRINPFLIFRGRPRGWAPGEAGSGLRALLIVSILSIHHTCQLDIRATCDVMWGQLRLYCNDDEWERCPLLSTFLMLFRPHFPRDCQSRGSHVVSFAGLLQALHAAGRQVQVFLRRGVCADAAEPEPLQGVPLPTLPQRGHESRWYVSLPPPPLPAPRAGPGVEPV